MPPNNPASVNFKSTISNPVMNAKIFSASAVVLCALLFQANAAMVTMNVARTGQVIDSSGMFNANFPASKVIDSSIDEGTNAPISYWIGPNGAATGYFILDMLGNYPVESVVLYNTHDRQSYGRGTGKFIVFAGNALAPKYSGNVDRYYRLDDTLEDATTNSAHGICYDALYSPVSATFSDDVPSVLTNTTKSVVFSGAGEFVEAMDPPGAFQPTAYSISVWVKLQIVQPCVVVVRTSSNGEYISHSHQIRVTADGKFQAFVHDGAERAVTGTTTIEPNVWYHVVATAQNGGFQRLYVNGVEEGSPTGVGAMWALGDRWRVGTGGKGGFVPMAGQVDDLAIWFSQPLTLAMITRLKNGETPATIVSTSGAGSFTIADPQVVVSGNLTQVEVGNPVIPPQTFAVSPPITARYILFQALEPYNTALPRVGLNEIQLMAQVSDVPPQVQVEQAVQINWPHVPFPVVPQVTPVLNGGSWTAITNPPRVSDTTWSVNAKATNNTGFYRLISP
jgi:hypothetical protein